MITREYLTSILNYNADTGIFVWRYRNDVSKNVWAGKQAGSLRGQGYTKICIKGKWYAAHRLAWLISYGDNPPGNIDHINGNRTDNRLLNLRIADKSQNGANRGRNSNSTSGIKGVGFDGRRWVAQIGHRGKKHFIGRFDTAQQAKDAYAAAAKRLFGDFARISW
jgi:hypothetical protein